MSLSAKRSAYSDMPSFSSQSAICCIAARPDGIHDVVYADCTPANRATKQLGNPEKISQIHVVIGKVKICAAHHVPDRSQEYFYFRFSRNGASHEHEEPEPLYLPSVSLVALGPSETSNC